jgi:predicted TPR repeat methyltransferase
MSYKSKPNYTVLAKIYNEVMKDVDYEDWADFIDAIIMEHFPEAETILELACGTGKIAMYLDELECYDILATDKSSEMLEQAIRIAEFRKMQIRWKQLDYMNIDMDEEFDVVLMLFDSLNYILKEDDLKTVFKNVQKVMHEDSLFIFDFTTQKHSAEVESLLNDEGITPDDYRFNRKSYYIPTEKIHINEFEIEKLDTDRITVLERFREIHKQKIYEFQEILDIVNSCNFNVVAAYEDFDLIDANNNSQRITMVLRCRKM